MSLVLSFGRPMVVRDIIRRSINSSQTLLLMKTLGNRISEPFHSLQFQSRSFSKTVFFRCYATETEEEKLQKKERRMEKIEQEKRQLINFGHKFNKMGGTKVVIAYFGLEAAFFLGIYGAFKAGLVTPDAIVALMNKYEFTARFSHLIANNPNASLLTLAYATNKLTSPLRMALTAAYGTYIVDKNKKKNKINDGEMKACGKDGQCGCHGEGKGEGGCCHGGNGGCKGGEGGCKGGKGECKCHGEGKEGGCCGGEGGCCGGEGGCCGEGKGKGGCKGGGCCGEGKGKGECKCHGEGKEGGCHGGEGGCCGEGKGKGERKCHGEGKEGGCCGGGCKGNGGEGGCCGEGKGKGGCKGGGCCGEGKGKGECKCHGEGKEGGCCGEGKGKGGCHGGEGGCKGGCHGGKGGCGSAPTETLVTSLCSVCYYKDTKKELVSFFPCISNLSPFFVPWPAASPSSS